MRSRYAGLAAVLAVTALGAGGAAPGRSAPLEPAACEQLQQRIEALRKDGVEADMAMGPEAARGRLPIERFNRIGTYIEVEEQLNFRCGLAKQRIILPTAVEGGEQEIPTPGEAAAAAATPGAALAPKARPAVKDAAAGKGPAAVTPAAPAKSKAPVAKRAPVVKSKEGGDSTAKSAEKPPAKAPPKKKATPKKPATKADDAYRPPPKPVVRSESSAPAAKQ